MARVGAPPRSCRRGRGRSPSTWASPPWGTASGRWPYPWSTRSRRRPTPRRPGSRPVPRHPPAPLPPPPPPRPRLSPPPRATPAAGGGRRPAWR
ncbi:hypothetical protein E6R62_19830 [Streptomyces sp. A1136]|nr:hypothetical protein E6R62_19830 [Streptomyces sp. A1136]